MSDFATPTRRRLLGQVCATLALAACGSGRADAMAFPVRFTEAEWKKRLTPPQFNILRKQGTERPFSSPLNTEHRKGTFLCAADGHALYSSATKFESHTGWPSFWAPLPGGVATSTDFAIGYPRTEVHCPRCGGHLGHVFNDGPKPTGKRYCMNGDAMTFRAA